MPECVWTNILSDSSFGCKVFDYCEYHRPGKTASATVKKQDILILDHGKYLPVLFINIYFFKSFPADRNKPLFIAFSCDHNKFFTIVYVCQMQINQFRDPEPATIKRFNDSFIPVAFGFTEINLIDYPVNLNNRQYFGKL